MQIKKTGIAVIAALCGSASRRRHALAQSYAAGTAEADTSAAVGTSAAAASAAAAASFGARKLRGGAGRASQQPVPGNWSGHNWSGHGWHRASRLRTRIWRGPRGRGFDRRTVCAMATATAARTMTTTPMAMTATTATTPTRPRRNTLAATRNPARCGIGRYDPA